MVRDLKTDVPFSNEFGNVAMSPEQVVGYKDYRLEVWSYGSAYRVLIWPPLSMTSLGQIPYSRSKSRLNKLIANAKAFIDEHIENAAKGLSSKLAK
jgi:hypothetical protein